MPLNIVIEIRIPDGQVEAFSDALTGDDNDILLAAESTMRRRIGGDTGEEIELWLNRGEAAELELRVAEIRGS